MTTAQFNPSQLRDLAAAKEAHAKGLPVEYCSPPMAGSWLSVTNPAWTDGNLYRPAPPPPQPRPWSCPSDVPGPVCWLRWPDRNDIHLIVEIGENSVMTTMGHGWRWEAFADENRNIEYSIDRKQWQPCVVTQP